MPIRPYRIQADFDPAAGRFTRADLFDCIETTHPITGEPQAGELIRRNATEESHPALFAALNAAINQSATDAAVVAQRAAHQAAKQAEAARLAELETAKTTKKD